MINLRNPPTIARLAGSSESVVDDRMLDARGDVLRGDKVIS